MPQHRKRRILLVTRNLPPLVGGMERLNWHMAEELAKVAEVRVIGPAGSAALAPEGVPVREAPLKPLWKFLWQARRLARREARARRPDIVLAGSGLTAPLARSAARLATARTVVYVHGLDVAVKHILYRVVWLRAIRRMDRVIANSRPTAELCRAIGVKSEKIGIVHPGVDLPEPVREPRSGPGTTPDHSVTFLAREESPSFRTPRSGDPESTRPENAPNSGSKSSDNSTHQSWRQQHKLANRPLLLSVGRLSERKGLREFVEKALPRIVKQQPDTVLLIVGDAPKQALHARAQSPESIQAAANAAGIGANVRFLGVITDYAELGDVYRAADVHVFPVRQLPGDPEGFGMVAVEAAAHGLPTVAFATGGIVDAVAEGKSGYLVVPGDYAALADATVRVLALRDDTMSPACHAFARDFAWLEFGRQIAVQLSQSAGCRDA